MAYPSWMYAKWNKQRAEERGPVMKKEKINFKDGTEVYFKKGSNGDSYFLEKIVGDKKLNKTYIASRGNTCIQREWTHHGGGNIYTWVAITKENFDDLCNDLTTSNVKVFVDGECVNENEEKEDKLNESIPLTSSLSKEEIFSFVDKMINDKKKGTFFNVVKRKVYKPKKKYSTEDSFNHEYVMLSKFQGRIGVDYGKTNLVKDRDLEANPIESLPWGHWVEGYFPFVIEHNDKYYLRLYPNGKYLENTYYKDGVQVSLEEVLADLGEKVVFENAGNEGKKKVDVMAINFDNILKLGN